MKYDEGDDGVSDKLIIRKRGNDGYKTFSIRIKEELVQQIDEIATETERSRNELIGIMIEYGLNNYEIKK